jgi:hypothetical protein
MNMRACRSTGTTYGGDLLPPFDPVPGLYMDFGIMAIAGNNTIAVVYDKQFTVTGFNTYIGDPAIRRGNNRGSHPGGYVQTFMVFVSACKGGYPPPEI